MLYARVKTKINYLLYKYVLNRFGFGNRVSTGIWEQQYHDGTWNYLFSKEESAHYYAICKQIQKKVQAFSVFDIGCGNGALYHYLEEFFGEEMKYSGIDISENAVKIATEKFKRGSFKKVDYDYSDFEGKFDIVVFNETLYYFIKPMKTIEKVFQKNLKPGGMIVISMCEDKKHNMIWQNINEKYSILEEETVNNDKGQHWTIKTIQLK